MGVPWEFGVTEIAMTTLFGAFLGPEWLPIGAAATILIRIVTDLFRFVVGFGAIQWIGIKMVVESENIGEHQKEMYDWLQRVAQPHIIFLYSFFNSIK